jgi:hypothetical protein
MKDERWGFTEKKLRPQLDGMCTIARAGFCIAYEKGTNRQPCSSEATLAGMFSDQMTRG